MEPLDKFISNIDFIINPEILKEYITLENYLNI